MQQASGPPPPRTRFRLARRPHRTVRSIPRTQLTPRAVCSSHARTHNHAQHATHAEHNARHLITTRTMCSPSAAHHSARQAPRPRPRQPHANAAEMPAARLSPSSARKPQARQGYLPRGRPSHATRYAASQAPHIDGWRQYLRPDLRAGPQASPNHQTRHLAARVCREDRCRGRCVTTPEEISATQRDPPPAARPPPHRPRWFWWPG